VRLVLLAILFSLSAGPVLALDDTNLWDQQVDSNGTITLEEGAITIQGSNNAGAGYPWQNTITAITTDSSLGETVSFDWSFWTTDNAYYDRPQVLWNDVWYDLANQTQQASAGSLTWWPKHSTNHPERNQPCQQKDSQGRYKR